MWSAGWWVVLAALFPFNLASFLAVSEHELAVEGSVRRGTCT